MSGGWAFLLGCVAVLLITILLVRYAIRQIDLKKKGW